MDDLNLLQEYVNDHSEDAFATVVSRHVDMVYSVALRQVGNCHQAQEVTQAVFIILARKAHTLGKGTILSGWLYRTARLTAGHSLRTEMRRIHREQEAYQMQMQSNHSESDIWGQIAPYLEEAIDGLRDKERDAIVLRFMRGKSLREVGVTLGTNEDAAQKTVSRAVEKLRNYFVKRGIKVSAGMLIGSMSANALQAAPSGLASVAAASGSGGGTVAELAAGTLKLMAWTKMRNIAAGIAAALVLVTVGYFGAVKQANAGEPPQLRREFRGVWVATVANMDWPSTNNLSADEQKAELTAILDGMAKLNCNAVVLQVRPMCDAFYRSEIEPWSEYLTGEMGKSPGYDPLEFAVAEAHKRGLELHAWFNPFRVRSKAAMAQTPAASNHVSKKHPELVRNYGDYLWLDPTEPAAHAYSLSVIQDVVRRYDIDGVHFDDYFYPYRQATGGEFQDSENWRRYRESGGQLSRADWRREHVNTFVQAIYKMVRAEKPWVKFGISPFGIWQPGNPAGITGLNAYEELYADSRKWLMEGWVDYIAPQLYWPIDAKEQSFPVLLEWWAKQNAMKRHLWPGMSIEHKGKDASEVVAEIAATRERSGASGNILWHSKTLIKGGNGIAEALAKDSYAAPALVPASPWLGVHKPQAPKAKIEKTSSGMQLNWNAGSEQVRFWILQTHCGEGWQTKLISGETTSQVVAGTPELPDRAALTAVDRFGNSSAATVIDIK